MYKKLHDNIRKNVDKDTNFGGSYPPYLKKEYDEVYQYRCRPSEFYRIVREEIESCSIPESAKNSDFSFWFGKYKGQKLFENTDVQYMYWICDVYRIKNPTLVGQVLLRLKELRVW